MGRKAYPTSVMTEQAVTKAQAVRTAVAAGYDSPKSGVAYIKAEFDIDMKPQVFSSYKSFDRRRRESRVVRSLTVDKALAFKGHLKDLGLDVEEFSKNLNLVHALEIRFGGRYAVEELVKFWETAKE